MKRTVIRSIESATFASKLAQGQIEAGWSKYPSGIDKEESTIVDVITTKLRGKDLSKGVTEDIKDLGCFEVAIPKEAGGKGLSIAAQSQIFEEIGKQSLEAAVTVFYNTLAHRVLAAHSGEESHSSTPNEIRGYGLTEPSTGSDIRSTKTTAQEKGDNYVLSGEKSWVTNASEAKSFSIFAKLNGKLSIFKVPNSNKITVSTNDAYPRCASLKFSNLEVPKTALIGPTGGAFTTTNKLNSKYLHLMSAAILGSQKQLLSDLCVHCDSKTAFGRTLRDLPLIKKNIADIALRVYAMESLLYNKADPLVTKILFVDAAKQNCEIAKRTMGASFTTQLSTITEALDRVQNIPITKEMAVLHHTLQTLEKCGSGLRSKSTSRLLFGRFIRTFGYTPRTDVGEVHPSLKQQAALVNKLVDRLGAGTENILVKFGKKLIDEQIVVSRVSDCLITVMTMLSVISRASKSASESSPTHQTEVTMAITWVKTEAARINGVFTELENVYKTTDSNLIRIADHVNAAGGHLAAHPCNA